MFELYIPEINVSLNFFLSQVGRGDNRIPKVPTFKLTPLPLKKARPN